MEEATKKKIREESERQELYWENMTNLGLVLVPLMGVGGLYAGYRAVKTLPTSTSVVVVPLIAVGTATGMFFTVAYIMFRGR
jgi:hypothetical protein